MTVRTFDYLFRTMQRGKGTPKNPPTVSAQFQVCFYSVFMVATGQEMVREMISFEGQRSVRVWYSKLGKIYVILKKIQAKLK